jgi:hypothetical protein
MVVFMSHAIDDEGPRPAHVIDYGQGLAPNRPTLGPGYDWLMEFARQSFRPALGIICILGLSRHFLWAAPELRLDDISLLILTGLAGGLAGLRTAELTALRR